jgi:hypothetical protein
MTGELSQATGAATKMWVSKETTYGVFDNTTVKRHIRLVPGETIDPNVQTDVSNEFQPVRAASLQRNTAQDPMGDMPFELSGEGWYFFFYHLLFGTPTVTGSSGGGFTHEIKAALNPPGAFTLEKQFLDSDTPLYAAFLGCRVNRMTLDIASNRIIRGVWNVIAREASEMDTTSLNAGAAPSIPTAEAFTANECTVLEGLSLTALGNVQSAQITIDNRYYADRSFKVGSELRANLKPGQRQPSGTLTVKFNSADLYNKALNEEITALNFTADDGTNSVELFFPRVKLTPTGASPKVADDGPIVQTFQWMAGYDATEATNVVATLTGPEDSLTD